MRHRDTWYNILLYSISIYRLTLRPKHHSRPRAAVMTRSKGTQKTSIKLGARLDKDVKAERVLADSTWIMDLLPGNMAMEDNHFK